MCILITTLVALLVVYKQLCELEHRLSKNILHLLRTSQILLISTDEDPGLWIESFAIIKLRVVTTKFKI